MIDQLKQSLGILYFQFVVINLFFFFLFLFRFLVYFYLVNLNIMERRYNFFNPINNLLNMNLAIDKRIDISPLASKNDVKKKLSLQKHYKTIYTC